MLSSEKPHMVKLNFSLHNEFALDTFLGRFQQNLANFNPLLYYTSDEKIGQAMLLVAAHKKQ